MGIYIGITVSTLVSRERWQAVYGEALGLAEKMGLADHQEREIHGHVVRCLVPTAETGWNRKKGFWAVADYHFRDSAEGFFFPKELRPPEDDEPVDILALRARQMDAIRTEIPEKNYQIVWGDKTQGHPYHISLLAIGCLVEDRLGDDALVHYDINAGQCRRAVQLANRFLEKPVRVPCQCDMEPWFKRVSRVNLDDAEKIRMAVELFIGRKDSAFGEKLRSVFPHDLLLQYWEEEFAEYGMKTNGFAWKLKDYLSMGFDIGDLCGIVKFSDEEGHEQFIRMLMDSKLHWKEKDTSDWMVQDPEDPALESIESQLIRAFASGARNRKVDRYIPIEGLRQILRDRFGEDCDTDGFVDEYLQQEKELEAACAGKKEQKDWTGELNRIMDNAHVKLKKRFEEYDIPIENYLAFYEPGDTVAPEVAELLQRITASGDLLMDGDHYKALAAESVMHRGTWLVSASGRFNGDLNDMDWEQIFTNLEKEPDSFSRYYTLFCIQLDKPGIRHAVVALVVNDELYAYARSLPPLPPGEKG